MITLRDARQAKADVDAYRLAADEREAAARKLLVDTLQANPRVGALIREGKAVFYTYDDGQYVEGSLDALAYPGKQVVMNITGAKL